LDAKVFYQKGNSPDYMVKVFYCLSVKNAVVKLIHSFSWLGSSHLFKKA